MKFDLGNRKDRRRPVFLIARKSKDNMWAKYIAVVVLGTVASGQLRRPNILLLVTDDQDVMLGSMDVMSHARQCITENGIEFSNAFTTTPICCPSRSSILTGLYTHNHHVYTNNDNCSSLLWQRLFESKSFATYLSRSGYHTGYFGKYLNEYNGSYTPPGWHYWMGLVKNSKYYNYTLLHNGERELHGNNYAEDYLTDLVTNRSIRFFRDAKFHDRERPVLSVVSFPAPHGPEDSAPQYQNLYQGVESHKTKSFDYVPNPDKHWIIRQKLEKMDDDQTHFSSLLQQKRLQTLRSVDDNIKKIVDMLRDLQELENTYIMYFSDHGYHIGQFGLAKGKSMPYDFDIRIPFLMRGPGLPRNEKLKNIALNIDIAPTILGMAGVPIPDEMDGRNLLDLFEPGRLAQRPWRDSFLVERGKMPRNKTQLVRPRMLTKLQRLQKLCASPNYANPCQPDQYWTCVTEADNKLRLQKCKKEKKPAKQKTRASLGPRRRKHCPCPRKQGPRDGTRADADEVNVLPTCSRGIPSAAGYRNHRSRRTNPLARRSFYSMNMKDIQKRTMMSYNKLRKDKEKLSKRRFKRDAALNSTAAASGRNDLSRRSSMVLTSSCRLYMPNFEIRCTEALYNDPNLWVRHMGHLARSVKTLQLKMKYMKTLRSCLNAYDERMKSQSRICECPLLPSRPKPPKPRSDPRDNASHPLLDLYTQDDQDYYERKRIFDEQREQHRMLKETRQAKLQRQAERERKGRTRVKRCSSNGATCFLLSNRTWQTEPKWERGNQCYCTNANNNTYWCIRIINEHTNVLYCQFITGFREYYDMNEDTYQLVSTEHELPDEQRQMYQDMIGQLRRCKGLANCTLPKFTNPTNSREELSGDGNSSSAVFAAGDSAMDGETPLGRDLFSQALPSVPVELPPSDTGTPEEEESGTEDVLDARIPARKEQAPSPRSPGNQRRGMTSRTRQRGSQQSEMENQGRSRGKGFQSPPTKRPKKKQTTQEVSSQNTTRHSEGRETQNEHTPRRQKNFRRRMGRTRPAKAQKSTRSKKRRKGSSQ